MSGTSATVAVLAVRQGKLPTGAAEVVADANEVVLVGSGVGDASRDLRGGAAQCWGLETGEIQVAAWARALHGTFAGLAAASDLAVVMLPAGPDAAVLGPGLAHCLGWPFVAGAIEVGPGRATQLLRDGLNVEELAIDGPFVATMVCRAPSAVASAGGGSTSQDDHTVGLNSPPEMRDIDIARDRAIGGPASAHSEPVGASLQGHVVSLGELPAVVSTMDLADAERIVAAGAGMGHSQTLVLLAAVGERIGAAMGATRVLADRGWVSHRRQIGTTGVAVNPRLYLAFGISGASQHTAGLGRPDHVVSVNVDASCPMMAMADLAVVADAPQVLIELAGLLGVGAQ